MASPDTWDKIPGINPVEYRARSYLLLAISKALRGETIDESLRRLRIAQLEVYALRRSDIHAFDAATLAVYARRLGIEEITTT